MNRTVLGWLAAIVAGCALAPGCSAEPETARGREAAATTSSSTSSSVAPTTTATTSSTTLLPAPTTAEDARRLLERQGVDPAELSREIGDGMRQRFGSGPR